ncbi:ras-specific guanine nucleotide-releasing factor 2-like isoform X3 [Lytechinus variegatus]|uniref:ras-specific guanine nucleotide-releasing factor 2-like isoform X3 n=1 Tax=Lytechinus variegatus TaxID=7654 RepID=UPI001BB29BCA|nr:ras-specific guanine nucleotide-releasing factor 2-like isoform X3 [Lytechinus variegatus]
MQKAIRLDDSQLLMLAGRAKTDFTIAGNLQKKSSDTGKWKQRWCALYENLLFYFENETTSRPLGLIFVEGCYSEHIVTPRSSVKEEKQYWYFSIHYRHDTQRQYELRCETEGEVNAWVDAIQHCNFNAILLQKEELEQKYLHLLQIHDSEKIAKFGLRQQCQELTAEVAKLKTELNLLQRRERKMSGSIKGTPEDDEPEDIKKIKRVQSFIRGWLCRRRWKAIVQDYIRSPHAESMRKRNSIVFGMVECEREYVEQLSTLVSCFLRPLKMAASAKKPLISHEDVNSIFLNSETIFFLHQIFYKGLSARMEHWPKLVLGDLFDMLLPMLSIYNEYVRNHHYSLQVLAECKQNPAFNQLLKQYETKPVCEARSLETFLTYPMHQVPRYIISLHELLAHTPHDHVERKSLEYAKLKLEELSRVMHDEVSETESIRRNLSIERMIVEGCDLLLDVQQMFVRQGNLIQVTHERSRQSRSRLGSLGGKVESRKEGVRQCFLFTKHLLITSRTSGGKLHLAKVGGKIPLIDSTIVEDFDPFDDDGVPSPSNQNSDHDNLDFKLIVDSKSGPPLVITLVASTPQEKAAWTSDISQCIDNLHYNGLLDSSMEDSGSSVHLPQCINMWKVCSSMVSCLCATPYRSDTRLFKDDHDIRFSKILNSCKVPQIRYASLERLLERLTDLRFLSIDFLNTFLLTFRVFTDWENIISTLERVYRNPDTVESQLNVNPHPPPSPSHHASDPHHPHSNQYENSPPPASPSRRGFIDRRPSSNNHPGANIKVTMTRPYHEEMEIDGAGGGAGGGGGGGRIFEANTTLRTHPFRRSFKKATDESQSKTDSSVVMSIADPHVSPPDSPPYFHTLTPPASPNQLETLRLHPKRMLSMSHSAPNIAALVKATKPDPIPIPPTSPHRSSVGNNFFQFSSSPPNTTVSAGVVVTSSRMSTRRSSCSSAAVAFAAATAGATNAKEFGAPNNMLSRKRAKKSYGRGKLQSCLSKEVISSAATVRVINVIRHWVSKFSKNFEYDEGLRNRVLEFLEEVATNPNLLPSEHRAASTIQRQIIQDHANIRLQGEAELAALVPDQPLPEDTFDRMSALELAEQLTYLEHKLLRAIPYWEFLNQAWMKQDKATRAPNILAVTRRFNEVSKLVSSEILRQKSVSARALAIERWAGVADICRCMHNFNSVLEITSALMNSSVYRLKKVWEKVPKQTKALLDKLQVLVSSDGRFKNMREALHRIDPPCVPYLGFYLTDLAFIEDGTPNITDDGLINFSKMRMIAHVVREIRHFQHTNYNIEPDKRVISYLLDTSLIMDDDEMYALSLELEPRQSTRMAKSI